MLGDLPSFLGFGLNCLAVTINRQATRTFSFVFGILWGPGLILLEGKLIESLKDGLEIRVLV